MPGEDHRMISADRRSVLVTGATGVVGSEILTALAGRPEYYVVGVSSRGDPARGIHGWRMGAEPPPETLRRRWDVVVHAAASTRWNMTTREAVTANIHSTQALTDLGAAPGRLVHLSTAHVLGRRGSIDSSDPGDYRNSYEWSKAATERWVRGRFDRPAIVRFPIVIGRRSDGHVARFSGFYKLLRALASGALPAVVGLPHAYLDMVPVDDVADAVVRLIGDDREPRGPRTVSLGCGPDAPSVGRALALFVDALNDWRDERGLPPLSHPPILNPRRWDRFLLPFAREHLSAVQLRVIDVFGEFRPYMCLTEPFPVTHALTEVDPAIRVTVTFWADRNPAAAGAVPRSWR